MLVYQIIASSLLLVDAILLTIIVLAQHGRSAYLGGAIAGGAAETFLGKKKARTIDSTLSMITKILGVLFVVLVFVVNILCFK